MYNEFIRIIGAKSTLAFFEARKIVAIILVRLMLWLIPLCRRSIMIELSDWALAILRGDVWIHLALL